VSQVIWQATSQITNIKKEDKKDKEQVEAIIMTMAKGREVDMINFKEKVETFKDRGEIT
jgi:hypothetical protein